MDDRIQQLRTEGRLEEAMTELLRQVGDGNRAAYRRHVLGSRCLLLDWARIARGRPFDRARFDVLRGQAGKSAALIAPRLAVLEAIFKGDSDIEQGLDSAVRQYEALGEYSAQKFIKLANDRLATDGRQPAFVARLPTGAQATLQALARTFGWLHPSLLLVGETWAYVWGTPDSLPAEHCVSTWGLLADLADHLPDGFVAQLLMESVPGGCGAFYPHPLSSAYLRTAASFQQSLQNAWYAVIAREQTPCTVDVRWSLRLIERESKLPLDACIRHRSMEAALACALRAVLTGEPLDQHTAITAKFALTGDEVPTDGLALNVRGSHRPQTAGRPAPRPGAGGAPEAGTNP